MKTKTRKQPEMIEGLEAFRRFDTTVGTLLSVPHSVIAQREREYRKQVEANPNRPGPKRKPIKPSAHASRAKR